MRLECLALGADHRCCATYSFLEDAAYAVAIELAEIDDVRHETASLCSHSTLARRFIRSARLSLQRPERPHFDPPGAGHRMPCSDIDRLLDAVAFENIEAEDHFLALRKGSVGTPAYARHARARSSPRSPAAACLRSGACRAVRDHRPRPRLRPWLPAQHPARCPSTRTS